GCVMNAPHPTPVIETANDSPLWKLPITLAYLQRIGATPRSMRSAAVTEAAGKYRRTLATIRVKKGKDGVWENKATEGYEPTEDEATKIKVELGAVKWPESHPVHGGFDKSQLPAPYSLLPDDALFFCHSPDRDPGVKLLANDRRGPEVAHPIIMIQARIQKPGQPKDYVPLTFWDDDKCRVMEPDRKL